VLIYGKGGYQYIAAEEIKPSNNVCFPIPHLKPIKPPLQDWATPGFFRLMGLYVAEGHSGHYGRANVTVWSYGHHEQDLVEFTYNQLFKIGLCPHIRKRATTTTVEISSVEWNYFGKWFGHTAHKKRLPGWLFTISPQLQEAFLKGYMEGDKGATVSQELAQHLKILYAQLGVLVSIREWDTMPGEINGRAIKGVHIYQVCETSRKRKYWHRVNNNFLLRVKRVSREPFQGKVFNFEVEHDNSYVAEAFSVHNCLVPKLEGRRIVEYDSFPIPVGKNPYLCDNNILATSWGHQQLVVSKLREVRNLDINSGFDDRIFVKDPEKYWQLYSELHLECVRFAYDVPEQKEAITFCSDFLHSKGVDYRHIIVFCLIGGPGSTFEESQERLQYLIDIGCSPYPQRYRPLDSVERRYNPEGWENGSIERLFQYYGVPFIWRSCKWEDFRK